MDVFLFARSRRLHRNDRSQSCRRRVEYAGGRGRNHFGKTIAAIIMLKRTPLFEIHQKLGGKLVEFGGWEMPVQYTSIMDEHQVVRKAAGLFDISHMGEVFVSGTQAAAFLNHVLTND